MLPAILAFHAERLHEDAVWNLLRRVAENAARQSVCVTFFVFPFRASIAGLDITDRVRALEHLGHEIAQHTHFYEGTVIAGAAKTTDCSPENIHRCIRRDYGTLAAMGTRPAGFTAGGWVATPEVWDTLVQLGFTYDCSTRLQRISGRYSRRAASQAVAASVYSGEYGDLCLIPTTRSLGEWARRVRMQESTLPYELIYLHDYDLLSPMTRAALWALLRVRGKSLTPLARLIDGTRPIGRPEQDRVAFPRL